MSDTSTGKRPLGLGIFLIVAGVVGFWAAFTLTLDKFAVLKNPKTVLSCDISPLVTCGKNLDSWQGSLFGFPNPLLGIVAWGIVIVIGVALLAGSVFPRWFWIVFNVGFVFAIGLVGFLISQSIFALSTLCIYCMITWVVTIPGFLVVTFRNLKTYLPEGRARRFFASAYTWIPIITLILYLVVAGLAQVRFNLIDLIF